MFGAGRSDGEALPTRHRGSVDTVVLLALLANGVLACTGPVRVDAGRTDATPPSLAATEFCARVMAALDEARCGYRLRCCTLAERDRLAPAQYAWPVPWSCADSLATRTAACVQALAAAGAFDPTRAGACAVAVASSPSSLLCNGPDPYYGVALPESSSAACAAIAGGGAPGSSCVVAASCSSGSCATPDGGTTGMCAITAASVGMPCASSLDCAHDAWCGPGSDGGMSVCRYRVQNGEPCGATGLGVDIAPSCRSTWCNAGICLPVCIGGRPGM